MILCCWDGLWFKLWDMGLKGKMWCVIKKMYEASRSAVFLEGEKSEEGEKKCLG